MVVRRRLLVLLAAAATALALVTPSAAAEDRGRSHRDLTVATYNVYLGGDIAPLLGARDAAGFQAAASALWRSVLATDFPERARSIADLLADERPDVVGLQEVSRWEVAGGPTLDFLDILLAALAAEGLQYVEVATNQNFASPVVPIAGVGGVKLTDRDVILVRADGPGSPLRTSGVSEQNTFAASVVVPFPTPTGPVALPILRGWSTVDVTVGRRTVRVANTHLETDTFAAFRDLQASELARVLGRSPHPVVVLGDLNADPRTGAAAILRDALDLADAWEEEGSGPGHTAGQDALLRNAASTLDRRIDYVLTQDDGRPRVETDDVEVLGEELGDRTASGLWPSDHAGVLAELELRGGRGRGGESPA